MSLVVVILVSKTTTSMRPHPPDYYVDRSVYELKVLPLLNNAESSTVKHVSFSIINPR